MSVVTRTLVAPLKTGYRRLSLKIFGNVIGIRANLLYTLYMALLRSARAFMPPRRVGGASNIITPTVETIRARGFAKIKPVLDRETIRTITAKVDALFARPDKVVTTLQDEGLIRLRGCLIEVPELEQFVMNPTVAGTLENYFAARFKVFACDVYRTLPPEGAAAAEKFGSLKWHFDNCPSVLFKIMVYLTDTTIETGAISLVPKAKSIEFKRSGFWERNKADRFTSEIDRNAVYLEGPPGTTLFFSTHYCIHKATLPRRRYRDVAVFLVQPAFRRQPAFSPRTREIYSFNFGYCVNPFSGAPQRYGDE